ncbi:hypothetical protein J437_LFUL015457, partial [Ladona fulva]
MKSYPGHKPGSSSLECVFNYRLSRARRIIENVLGIMSAKLRIFLKPNSFHPDKRRNAELKSFTLPLIHLVQRIPTITLSPDHGEKKLNTPMHS